MVADLHSRGTVAVAIFARGKGLEQLSIDLLRLMA